MPASCDVSPPASSTGGSRGKRKDASGGGGSKLKRSVGIGRLLDFAEVACERADHLIEKWRQGKLPNAQNEFKNHSDFISGKLEGIRSKLLCGEDRLILQKLDSKASKLVLSLEVMQVHSEQKSNNSDKATTRLMALGAGDSAEELESLEMPLETFKCDACDATLSVSQHIT